MAAICNSTGGSGCLEVLADEAPVLIDDLLARREVCDFSRAEHFDIDLEIAELQELLRSFGRIHHSMPAPMQREIVSRRRANGGRGIW